MTDKATYIFTAFALIAFIALSIIAIHVENDGAAFIGWCGVVLCSVYLKGEYSDVWQ